MTAPMASASSGTPGWRMGTFHRMIMNQLPGEIAQSQRLETEATNRSMAWDPSAAYRQYMQGAKYQLDDSLSRQLEQLAGSAAGAGRLDTGFYNRDQGDVMRAISGDYTAAMDRAALSTAQMGQEQTQFNAGLGTNRRTRAFDLIYGSMDQRRAEQIRRDQKEAQKKGWFSQVLGGALGLGMKAIPIPGIGAASKGSAGFTGRTMGSLGF